MSPLSANSMPVFIFLSGGSSLFFSVLLAVCCKFSSGGVCAKDIREFPVIPNQLLHTLQLQEMGNIRCPAGTVTIHLTVQQFALTVSNVVLNNIPNRIHVLCPVHRLPEYLITPGHKMRLIQALRIPFEKVQEIPFIFLLCSRMSRSSRFIFISSQ